MRVMLGNREILVSEHLIDIYIFFYLPAVVLQQFGSPEDLLYSTWDDPMLLHPVAALHGVRLATSCLAVRKATHVVTIQG